MGRLPEAWLAPPAVRELRELVRYRAKLVALRSGHPYVRLPILFALELRPKILEAGLAQAPSWEPRGRLAK